VSTIDRAVAAYAAQLRGPRRARRRLVDEVAAHLDDAVEAELAAGADRPAAERAVLERFGDLHASAELWNRDGAARRGASRRNALLLACAAVTAAALGVAQHASGKNPPARPCAQDQRGLMIKSCGVPDAPRSSGK
jgi:hypothetical protein